MRLEWAIFESVYVCAIVERGDDRWAKATGLLNRLIRSKRNYAVGPHPGSGSDSASLLHRISSVVTSGSE